MELDADGGGGGGEQRRRGRRQQQQQQQLHNNNSSDVGEITGTQMHSGGVVCITLTYETARARVCVSVAAVVVRCCCYSAAAAVVAVVVRGEGAKVPNGRPGIETPFEERETFVSAFAAGFFS